MNKNNLSRDVLKKKTSFNHFLLIMRTTVFLLFACVFVSLAETGYSQNARVTLNKNKASLKDVLNEIENQTDYLFIYNNEVNTNKTVSVKTKNEAVRTVLKRVLKDSNIDFLMEGNHIILSYIEEKLRERDEEVVEAVQQQGKTITGVVTDTHGEFPPGVTVIIKGTTRGTTTDIDGNFTLTDVSENEILQFSYVGMLTQEIAIKDQTRIDITLVESAIGLDEIVAIGYGTMKKSDLTGSVASVDGAEIAKRNLVNVSQSLQGITPGLMVTRGGGSAADASATIRIRGITTIGDSNPLIIVDGVPVASLDYVNPNDIENISVLKDAASSSIYGSKAASGVILITTKQGRSGQLQMTYDYNYVIEQPTRTEEYANVVDYMKVLNEISWNDNNNEGSEFPIFSQSQIENYYNSSFPPF